MSDRQGQAHMDANKDGMVKYMLLGRHHATSSAPQHDQAFLSSNVCPPFVAVRKQRISSLTSPTPYGGLSALITPPWPCSAVPTGIEVIPRCDVQGHEGWGILPNVSTPCRSRESQAEVARGSPKTPRQHSYLLLDN